MEFLKISLKSGRGQEVTVKQILLIIGKMLFDFLPVTMWQ
jgi:hypothetical protein